MFHDGFGKLLNEQLADSISGLRSIYDELNYSFG